MSRRDVELLLLHWLLSDAFASAFVMAATLEFRGSDSFPSQDFAAVYVGSFWRVHNPLFSFGKLRQNEVMQRFQWSIRSK